MCSLKSTRLYIFITIILLLIHGCSGAAVPTVTQKIAPPTEAMPESPPTLGRKAEPGPPGVGDSLYPHLGNGGYDVQHYTLDLTGNSGIGVNCQGAGVEDMFMPGSVRLVG